jgi:hypothetical protein
MLLPDAASVEERRSTAATSANDDASIAAVHTGEEAEAELETDTSFGLRLELRPHRTYRRGKREGRTGGGGEFLSDPSWNIWRGVPASQRVQLRCSVPVHLSVHA